MREPGPFVTDLFTIITSTHVAPNTMYVFPGSYLYDLYHQQGSIQVPQPTTSSALVPDQSIALVAPIFAADSPKWMQSTDLESVADDIITRYNMDAKQFRVGYCWKKNGGKRGGKPILGKTTRASGQSGFLAGVDVMIWLAADHLNGLAPDVVEAVLHHELLHIGEDEDTGELIIIEHDFTGFVLELDRYGAYTLDLAIAKQAFEQARLPEYF